MIRVAQGSPAQHAGLCVDYLPSEPFFDFCIGIDGRPLYSAQNPADASGIAPWMVVEEKEGQEITLTVWNFKYQEMRGTSLLTRRSCCAIARMVCLLNRPQQQSIAPGTHYASL